MKTFRQVAVGIGAAVLATSAPVCAQKAAVQSGDAIAGARRIWGSYRVALVLPKASPVTILTFCREGKSFEGAWVEDNGLKVMGPMYNQTIDGDHYRFTVKVGPGVWDFVVYSDGKMLKGTVTGDGATSAFEGPRTSLKKNYCA